MSQVSLDEPRPGEKNDRIVGAILMAAGILLFALAFAPLRYLEDFGLDWIRHIQFIALFGWTYAGYTLRNSYAENLGEGPEYRTPRWRRITAALFFVPGLICIPLAVFRII